MTKFRRFYYLLLALAAAVITVALLPFAPKEVSASLDPDKNFYFQSIDVNIEVGRDKIYRITERLEVVFKDGDVNSGIIRDIQRISRTTRVFHGKAEKGGQYLAGLSDVRATIDGEAAKVTLGTYDSGQFHSVTMELTGDRYFESSSVDGTHLFELSYLYDVSDDPVNDFVMDVLGFAMAGCELFTATVTFPEKVNAAQVTVREDVKNLWTPDEDYGEYIKIRKNTVSLCATVRSRGEGLTMQVLLPDGYFSSAHGAEFKPLYLIAIFALIAGMGGSFALIFVYKTRKPIAPVTLFPPENMSLARASAVYHKASRRKDMAAYFLKWAAKGYVTLERDGDKHFTAIRTEKTAEREDFTASEAAFFLAAFPRLEVGEKFSTREISKNAERKRTLSYALADMQKAADEPSPLAKGKKKYSWLIFACSLLPMFGVLLYYSILLHEIFPIFFMIFIVAGSAVGMNALSGEMPLFVWIFPIVFTAFPLGVFYTLFYMGMYDFMGILYISVVWWAVSYAFHALYGKRTEEGQREYGELIGFRDFLLTAEISRIEALLDETPDYFYGVLPYCLVLGIGDKVQKRYAALGKALPVWAEWEGKSFTRAVAHTSMSVSRFTGGGGGGGHSSHGGGGHHGSHGGGGGGGGSRGAGRH